jgi:hypothetical protein
MRVLIFVPNLKLNAQTFSRKITRACVPLMVVRIGHNWDAAGAASLVVPMVQTMVVAHNIASIQDYEEYDALRNNRPAAERVLLQGFFRRQITVAQRPFVTRRGN